MRERYVIPCGEMRAGQDLVAAGYIALKGTSETAKSKEKELLARFSPQFVKKCRVLYENRGLIQIPGVSSGAGKAFSEAGETDPETAAFLLRAGASSWCAAGNGGIMAALWDYFDAFGLGFVMELRKLPLLQETVEVCEVTDLNLYRLCSEGCVLLTADNGGHLAAELEKRGIHAVVIGRTKKSIGREIHNGEIRSFLDRPKPDEIQKIRLTGGEG